MSKPTILMTFAANDLAGVHKESEEIWQSVSANELVNPVKLENAEIVDFTNAIIDAEDLFMFHFGGHADQGSIKLDGFKELDKTRLSRILKNAPQLQLVFLNGCLSNGHVDIMTAKGIKAIIATNVKIDDIEATRLATFFYKMFFLKKATLLEAFQTAEATVTGNNSFPIIVNPGEECQMPASWTLFVHSGHTNVLDWALTDFFPKTNSTPSTHKDSDRGGIPSDKILTPVAAVKKLVAEGNLPEALSKLSDLLPEEENAIIGLLARTNRLLRNIREGVIDSSSANVERNRLEKAVLEMLDLVE